MVIGSRAGARSRTSCARCARCSRSRCSRRSPCGSRSASAARPASRAARSRRCSPSACFRCAALRAARSSAGASRRTPSSSRSSVWLLALAVPLTGARVPRRPRALVAVHRRARRSGSRARLRAHPGPGDLRAALAEAFDDPALDDRLLARRRRRALGRRRRRAGRAAVGRAGRCRHRDPRRRPAGRRDRPRRRAARTTARSSTRATSYALMTLDNHRLSAQTSSLLREVRESRARIQAAADDERRRIERDLHDGAQQRLVALRIKLELAAERTDGDGDGAEGAALLRRLGDEVEEALDEVRSLARGIYPAPLADRGLVEALRAAALRNAAADHGARRGRRPLLRARSRPPRTSAAWRRSRTPPSTRQGATRRRRRAVRQRLAATRGARRRRRLRPAARRRRRRVHEHARPPRRGRRRAHDRVEPRPRDARGRHHPAREAER